MKVHLLKPHLVQNRCRQVHHNVWILSPPLIPSIDPFLDLREMFRIRQEINRRLRSPDGYSP